MKKTSKELLFERMHTIGGMVLNENLNFDQYKNKYIDFLKQNNVTGEILFHGTKEHPTNFELRDDFEGSDNVYDISELPEEHIFLTDDFREASSYGKYVIPMRLKDTSKYVVETNSDNPSKEFDDDYSGYGGYGMWTKFQNESQDAVLQVKGLRKSTYITPIYNVTPLTDIADQFYKRIEEK